MRLSLLEYMRYIGGTHSSRCVYEGEEVLNAGHVILCGKLNSSTSEKLNLCALCLQTSALTSDPHQIKGILALDRNGHVQIKEMSCSCKAGNSGRCKHISAVLIKCSRSDLQELELICQTDLKCVWNRQKHTTREKYRAVPIKNMPCFTKKVEEHVNISLFDEKEMLNFFIAKLPNSAISKHSVGRRSVNEQFEMNLSGVEQSALHFTAILDHSCQSVLMMELHSIEVENDKDCCKEYCTETYDLTSDNVVIAIIQQSKEWHQQRQFRVTGSRIYEIFTYSGGDWETKSIKYFYLKSFTNKFVKHGIKYESEAKDTFIATSGLEVIECGMVLSHSNPWLGYSPDGVILENGKPVALLEIKCLYEGASKTVKEAMENAKFLREINGEYFLKENHKYNGQIQLGMGLLNVDKCYLVIYASFDKSLAIIEVPFNYEFASKLLSVTKKKFFDNMIHFLCENRK